MMASLQGSKVIVKLLLMNGAEVNEMGGQCEILNFLYIVDFQVSLYDIAKWIGYLLMF
jgi:hypothetical protein